MEPANTYTLMPTRETYLGYEIVSGYDDENDEFYAFVHVPPSTRQRLTGYAKIPAVEAAKRWVDIETNRRRR